MSFATCRDRSGKSRGEGVGVRAVADQGRQLGPFFFDGVQLFQNVFAFNRFDALAKGLATGDGLPALSRLFGLRFHVAATLHDTNTSGICAGGEPARRLGRDARQRFQCCGQPRQFRLGSIGVGHSRQAVDCPAQQGFLSAQFFFRRKAGRFRVFEGLQNRTGSTSHWLLLSSCLDHFELRHVRCVGVDHTIKRGEGHCLVIAVECRVEQFVGCSQPRDGRVRRAFDFCVSSDATKRTIIRNTAKGGFAHHVLPRALCDRRQAPAVSQLVRRRQGQVGFRDVAGQSEQLVGGGVTNAGVGVRCGHSPKYMRIL